MSYKVYGSSCLGNKPVEAIHSRPHQFDKTKVVASVSGEDRPIDILWLKAASETYKISDDISDYIIVPVPIITVDIPNRNLQAFPNEEVTSWNTDAGRIVYQTFIGKPLFLNHDNEDEKKSKGIILDSIMKYIPKYDVWKIIELTAWDRTKDKDVANHILKDSKSEYSMGSMVRTFIEYPTGKKVKPKDSRGYINKEGKLVYHICLNSCFFETSLITEKEGAADCTAINTQDEIIARPGDLKW
jgi:hypothetical protein